MKYGEQQQQMALWQQWLNSNEEGTVEGLFKKFGDALAMQFNLYKVQFEGTSQPAACDHTNFNLACGADGLRGNLIALTNVLLMATNEYVKNLGEAKKEAKKEPELPKTTKPEKETDKKEK